MMYDVWMYSSRGKSLAHNLLQLRLVTVSLVKWQQFKVEVKSTTLNKQKGEMMVMSQRLNGKEPASYKGR